MNTVYNFHWYVTSFIPKDKYFEGMYYAYVIKQPT